VIDKTELRAAFSRSGITLSSAKLDAFFEDVDANKDGVISYPEWRYVHEGSDEVASDD
jgi:solute carrier family 25 phosphate transporter 23/24/25/41